MNLFWFGETDIDISHECAPKDGYWAMNVRF